MFVCVARGQTQRREVYFYCMEFSRNNSRAIIEHAHIERCERLLIWEFIDLVRVRFRFSWDIFFIIGRLCQCNEGVSEFEFEFVCQFSNIHSFFNAAANRSFPFASLVHWIRFAVFFIDRFKTLKASRAYYRMRTTAQHSLTTKKMNERKKKKKAHNE